MREIAYDRARESALRILNHGDNIFSELSLNLAGKHFDRETIDEVLADLADAGLIDDERYAENYILSGLERGKGPVWIRNKLREKGVAPDCTERLFEELCVYEREKALCMKLALSVCGLSGDFNIDEYGCLYQDEGSVCQYETDFFGRTADGTEKNFREAMKKKSAEKSRLVRRLANAGFSRSAVMHAVKEIENLHNIR